MIQRRKIPRRLAPWTRTPSGKRLLASAAARSEKSAAKREAYRRLKSFARKPIRMKSPKQAKSDRLYTLVAKEFLSRPENRMCQVEEKVHGRRLIATCVHHLRGRHRTLKFDTRFFCATNFMNSLWPHQNIEKARALGLIAQAGDWAREPGDEETERIRIWMVEKGIW